MTDQEAIVKACQVLRSRVRFKKACLTLPGHPFPSDDTDAIRKATELFTETWIVPLLDCIESGDLSRVHEYYEYEKGDEMELRKALQ